jgi:hypothetical protein
VLAQLFREHHQTLATFLLSFFAPLRFTLAIYKYFVMRNNRAKFGKLIYCSVLWKIPYPQILNDEIANYKDEFQRTSWLLMIFVGITICHNLVNIVFGLPYVVQNYCHYVIPIWWPFEFGRSCEAIGERNLSFVCSSETLYI